MLCGWDYLSLEIIRLITINFIAMDRYSLNLTIRVLSVSLRSAKTTQCHLSEDRVPKVSSLLLAHAREDRPQQLIGSLLLTLLVELHAKKISDVTRRHFVLFVGQRRKSILKHVGSTGEVEQRQGAGVHAVGVVGPPGKNGILDTAKEPLLHCVVAERVCRHVEDDKILFVRRADAFVHETLGETLAHVTHLITDLHWIPCLT